MIRAAVDVKTDMTSKNNLKRALLLTCLLLTGVRCEKEAVFLYHRLGDDAVLPCTKLNSSDCSLVTWTSYKGGTVEYTQEVSRGKVKADSVRASRMSITSSCDLGLRDLSEGDANSYACLSQDTIVTEVYLSLLTITSPSTITDLQPGRDLTLNCVLFTFYDAGNCRSFSSSYNLRWVAEDGTELQEDSRYKLTVHNSCNISLVTKLRREDNNRRWRCQANTKENSRVVFLDFRSAFLFEDPPPAEIVSPTAGCPDCSGCSDLPISRIVLCVALPVMVLIVWFFTWRGDRKRAKTSAAGIELREFR